ncbi:5654_t:CDS:2, partial [Acaulospora morrowiae]
PNKTLSKGVIVGTKKSKEHVMVLLTCNALGEKIKPTFIYRYENPQALKNIQKSTLPVFYYWNNKAKYRQLLCENHIQEFDKEMETGILPSKLSILDVIQMTATAWNKITTNTIKNCWIKTGILLLLYDNTKIILSELEEKIEADENTSEEIIEITNKEAIEYLEKLQKYLNQEN